MGLAERRAAKEFEDKQYPLLKKEIEEAAKFKVPIEVAWETLAEDGMSHMYEECWKKVYFTPLIDAIAAITVDDMGKDALKGALKKIVLQNRHDIYYGDRCATFADGVLTIDHKPTTNVDSIKEREDGIRTLLEKSL